MSPNVKEGVTEIERVIWFNPPYNKSVKTNAAKIFFDLIKKHFNNLLKKLFNRYNLKGNYCCNKNMHLVISFHNNKILNGKRQWGTRT